MTRTSARCRRALLVFLCLVAGVGVLLGVNTCVNRSTVITTGPAPAPAKVTVSPPSGTLDVSPTGPVAISVTDGTVQSVTLTAAGGKQVTGRLTEDKRGWIPTEPLSYGTTFTWGGTAIGADSKPVPVNGSFTTVSPRQKISGRLNVGDDQTYGIAMPIAITFSGKVTDKAAVEKALTVHSSPHTEGSWAWLENDTTAHWRPREYWQPNTTVKVAAKIHGVRFGEGVYGSDDLSVNFTIGRSQIVKGDTRTHRMRVIRDGQQIADYPASYGTDSDPGQVTNSGTHVVMEKHPTFSMSNPRYGYYNVKVPWAIRISNNGEFIHGREESTWAQGSQNVSHGCVNLSPANAKEYYDGALIGDPVEIEGSSQQLGSKDGDYFDWTYSWDSWRKLSALES